jgi:3-isopropylmalate dehydrogenase
MKSNSFHLAMMPGEGIGIEVMEAATAVLGAVEDRFGLSFWQEAIPGGAHHYKETGAILPKDGMARAKDSDAILFGAMGWPDIRFPDGTEIAPQLDMRFAFDLYAGVRPIRAIPGVPATLADDRAGTIDLVIVRESTEGMFASRGKGEIIDNREARDTQVITRATTERLTDFCCKLARRRKANRGKPGRVTIVDKANVFRSFAFMRQVFYETAAKHPDIEARHHYVDAMENMFGDILSDLAAGLIGGMGFAPSADLGDKTGMFQPSHGTAPDIAGKGIANPTGMILSAAMMLDWLAEMHGSDAARDAAGAIERSVDIAFGERKVRSYDIGGRSGTRDIGKTIADQIRSGEASPQ